MAEVVNLGKVRKSKTRAEARVAAEVSSVKFGRTKGQKARETAEAARSRAELDGKKRGTD